ncbi:hypothetical protein [Natrialba swarupiae]|uniref:Uncharacterized protein n=1 Tax=Natrialba swarupiae TaxID=2448032 RepID=A0A5D5ALD6_9EURY|nr:hypothetical protein [Natrialba swarupiae]TYT61803.1 hypothetical protein FYC77_11195 [Natrialba swarupiae]
MSEGYDIDLEMLLIIPFSWGAAASLGMIDDNIIWFLDAGSVIFEQGNVELTVGRIVSLASLLFVLVSRDASLSDTRGIDVWIVYATVGLIVAPPLFPAFADTLAHQPAAMISFTVQSTGFLLVSYIN